MNIRILLCAVAMAMVAPYSYAQSIAKVNGKVKDVNGEAITGAYIKIR